MIGSDVILFPETGPEFLNSLRTAVLYSQHVHVLTSLNVPPPSKESEVGLVQAGTGPYKTALVKRMLQYFSFVRDVRKDLLMLAAEGILKPLTHNSFTLIHELIDSAAADVLRHSDGETFAQVENLITPILKRTPPSFADFSHLARHGSEAKRP
jgi:hypothetical protein